MHSRRARSEVTGRRQEDDVDHDSIDEREPHSEIDSAQEGNHDVDPQTGLNPQTDVDPQTRAKDASDAEQTVEAPSGRIPAEVSEVLETDDSAGIDETDDIDNTDDIAEASDIAKSRETAENDEAAENAETGDVVDVAETGSTGGSSDAAHSAEPDDLRQTPVTPDNGYSRESYAIHATRSELPLFNDALKGGRNDLSWVSSLSSVLGGSNGPVGSAEGAAAVAHAAIDRRNASDEQAGSAS